MEYIGDVFYEYGGGLYANLTNKCPCRCEFCIRDMVGALGDADSLWLRREPTLDEIKELLREWDLNQFYELVFCGYGEPTERLEVLRAAAKYIKNNSSVPTRLNTNGLSDLIHGRDTAKELEGLLDTVSISLNAGTVDEYLKVTRPKFGEEAYTAMQRFASQCKEYVPNVVFTVVDVIGDEEIKAAQAALLIGRTIPATSPSTIPIKYFNQTFIF